MSNRGVGMPIWYEVLCAECRKPLTEEDLKPKHEEYSSTEGKFYLICQDYYDENGAVIWYDIIKIGGDGIPTDVILPILNGRGAPEIRLESLFDGRCDGYVARETEVYRLLCSWEFESGDMEVGLPPGFSIYMDGIVEMHDFCLDEGVTDEQ